MELHSTLSGFLTHDALRVINLPGWPQVCDQGGSCTIACGQPRTRSCSRAANLYHRDSMPISAVKITRDRQMRAKYCTALLPLASQASRKPVLGCTCRLQHIASHLLNRVPRPPKELRLAGSVTSFLAQLRETHQFRQSSQNGVKSSNSSRLTSKASRLARIVSRLATHSTSQPSAMVSSAGNGLTNDHSLQTATKWTEA